MVLVQLIKLRLFSPFIFGLMVIFSSSAQECPHNAPIKQIIIHGNKVTKTELIKAFFAIDTGMAYDSVMLARGEKAIESTNLFTKVDVFSICRSGGKVVYIMITEKPYLLPGLSGELYSRKYGKDETWWRLKGGIEHINFRGRMEIFKTTFSIWDWKAVGLSWQKPLTPSPYYFGVGSSIDLYPDEASNIRHTAISGKAIFGRTVSNNSKTYLSLIPFFKREISTHSITPNLSEPITETVIDTLRAKELFAATSWLSDFRNNRFDPSEGLLFFSDLRTNHIYSGSFKPFFQFSSDIRFHHPGIFPYNKVVYRLATILRDTDGGSIHRIQLGGEGSVRGYPRQSIGNRFIANNSIIFSTEYRFPIFEFPAMKVPVLSNYSSFFSSVRYRIDGALIFDYGRVTKSIDEILSINGKHIESGTAIGFGLRLMIPTFERSICADFVFGDNPYTEALDFRFPGAPHLYLDLYF